MNTTSNTTSNTTWKTNGTIARPRRARRQILVASAILGLTLGGLGAGTASAGSASIAPHPASARGDCKMGGGTWTGKNASTGHCAPGDGLYLFWYDGNMNKVCWDNAQGVWVCIRA